MVLTALRPDESSRAMSGEEERTNPQTFRSLTFKESENQKMIKQKRLDLSNNQRGKKNWEAMVV